MRRSAKLVETALDLGIRYFDVAPSYGLGTAEEVIGAVLAGSQDVVIATKVGVPRPIYSARANWIRMLVKPVLDRSGALKSAARSLLPKGMGASGGRPRYDFSSAAIRSSLEISLEKLRRTSIDVYLAHEPHPDDLNTEVEGAFRALRDQGLFRAFGVGIGEVADRWTPFGTIWQSCWPGPAASGYAGDVEHVWHGAVRTLLEVRGGVRPSPAAVVRQVIEASPDGILLVSASTPKRLRELVSEID